jgi:hypothetical protein
VEQLGRLRSLGKGAPELVRRLFADALVNWFDALQAHPADQARIAGVDLVTVWKQSGAAGVHRPTGLPLPQFPSPAGKPIPRITLADYIRLEAVYPGKAPELYRLALACGTIQAARLAVLDAAAQSPEFVHDPRVAEARRLFAQRVSVPDETPGWIVASAESPKQLARRLEQHVIPGGSGPDQPAILAITSALQDLEGRVPGDDLTRELSAYAKWAKSAVHLKQRIRGLWPDTFGAVVARAQARVTGDRWAEALARFLQEPTSCPDGYVQELLTLATPPQRLDVLERSFASMGDQLSEDFLVAKLRDDDPRVRMLAVDMLVMLRESVARRERERLLQDLDPAVRAKVLARPAR